MATSARQEGNGFNSFLDKYRTNLNSPRGSSNYAPSCCQCTSPRSNYVQQTNYSSAQQPQNYGSIQQSQNYGPTQQSQNYGSTQQSQNYGPTQQSQNYGNNFNTATLRSSGNSYHDERFGNEILARAGPSHHYQRSDYRTHEVIAPEGRMDNLNVQSDNDPLHVVKPTDQNIHYKQQVNVRFLQPPPGPEPAPIIIRERQAPAPPAPPPLVIRQRLPTPPTPPPLIIRERPPTPPVQQQPQIIEKILPPPPAPPRQVIVERLPPPPPKPRQVIYEKWLPYAETKERPVIVHRAPPLEIIRPMKNVIIEHEQAKCHHEQVVTDEGVFHADPQSHNATSAVGEIRLVDRITDLPVDYSKYLTNRRPPSRSVSSSNMYDQQQQAPQPQFSQTEPAQQYRSTTYNNPTAYTTTYRASYKDQNSMRNGLGQSSINTGNQSSNFAKYV